MNSVSQRNNVTLNIRATGKGNDAGGATSVAVPMPVEREHASHGPRQDWL